MCRMSGTSIQNIRPSLALQDNHISALYHELEANASSVPLVLPIPVAYDVPTREEIDNVNTHNNNEEIIHKQQENDTITGVHENEQNNSTNDDDTPEHDPENTHNNAQTTPEEEKNESDKYVT